MKPNLSPVPEIVTTKPMPILYLQKTGPFMKTAPAAWQDFGRFVKDPLPAAEYKLSLHHVDKIKTGDDAFTYQAVIALKSATAHPPAGLQQRTVESGKYARFILSGSYAQLPEAYPAIYALLEKHSLKMRNDFSIEKYLNDYATTEEGSLKTEILIPIE